MDKRKDALRFSRYLNAIEHGKNVDTWLAKHADVAEEVVALGHISQALKSMSSEENRIKHSETKSLQRFLAAAQNSTPQSMDTSAGLNKQTRWQRLPLLQRSAMIGMVVLIFLTSIGGGLVYASNSSLPGDPFYSVKLAREGTQLFFAQGTSKRILLEERLSDRRLLEVNTVLANQREVAVHFDGVLYDMQPDHWIIDKLLVQIPSNTAIDGNPTLGCYVDVYARTTSQWELIATAIRVEGATYRGQLKAIESDILTINGIRVAINPTMPVNPTILVGDAVFIHTRNLPNGEKYILRIEPDTGISDSRRLELSGPLEIIDATHWRIGEYSFLITPQTHIEDSFQTGDQVRAIVVRLLDSSFFAVEIEFAGDHSESPALDLVKPEEANESEPKDNEETPGIELSIEEEKEPAEEQKPEETGEENPAPHEDGEMENNDHHTSDDDIDSDNDENTHHDDESKDNDSGETEHEQDHISGESGVKEDKDDID